MLDTLFEDNYLLVVNKPAGLMVEEDRLGNKNLKEEVYTYLKQKSIKEPLIENVHRLDRPASGVVLFAKKKLALKIMNEQFQKRAVEKIYYAITTKAPSERKGKLCHYHIKDTLQKKAVLFDKSGKDTQKVELEYSITDSIQGYHLWRIKLMTGKYHQIRAQLGFLKCPIVGDKLYGSAEMYAENQICLHARRLTIQHPVSGNRMEFTAPFPEQTPYTLFQASLNKKGQK